ncbi:MAG: thiamine pyrophosphate-dependent enzyme [Christensenellales bacterium]
MSTTGKASRELFEMRESEKQPHDKDFFTVGSMGHSSSTALGIALQIPEKTRIIDGDGSMLMHMGSMAVIGAHSPRNVIHVIINNGADESVGGQLTVAGRMNIMEIALDCGYPKAVCIDSLEDLDQELQAAKARSDLCLIQVKCAVGARADLGRPTTTAKTNKELFMRYLSH